MNKTAEIYTFQNKIPKFKIINTTKEFQESPIKPAIMKALSEGVHDAQSQTQDQLRYALTAKEIKQKLESTDNPKVKKVSYTNLYFHLNKMEEAGIIKQIAKVIEKSHRITYYGRSAHVVLLNSPETEIEKITQSLTELFKLMKIINAEFPDIKVNILAEQFFQEKEELNSNLAKWIADNIDIIRNNNLDVSKIFKGLKFSEVRNSKINKIFDKYFPFISD